MEYKFKGTPGSWGYRHGTITDGFKTIATVNHGLSLADREEYPHNVALLAASKDLLEACIKSLEVFKQLADAGRYPEPLMADNGGEGFSFLTNAISKALNLTSKP